MPKGMKGFQKKNSFGKLRKGKKWSKEARERFSKNKTGKQNTNWKGGKSLDSRGYFRIKVYNHPFRDKQNTVFEHRLVMEKYLKRFLTKKEIVHHINGVPTDNRIENLKLFANHSIHRHMYRKK